MGSRLGTGILMVLGMVLPDPVLPVRADDPAQEPAPIPVVAQVPARTYYVGQAIELRVGAEAAGERPEMVTPEIPDTEVAKIGNELSAVAATGIGNLTSERNLFITRFRLLPRRAGMLTIPPVRVRLGARTGASRPLRVEVLSLPLAGRPGEFLGGVGAFEVAAAAQPGTVRVGQDLTYTIDITGPAARGMTGAPGLARFSNLPLGLQIKSLPTFVANRPPSRQYRYRLRPTRPGAALLPPVAVAAFDPRSARYITHVTASIAIRVLEVPRYDPATLDYGPPRARETRGRLSASAVPMAAGVTLGIALVAGAILVGRAFWKGWRIDPGRWLMCRARRLDTRSAAACAAREIRENLAEYLERSTGRPRGVLTPEEARSAIAAATQDADLGARGARLVADCDRACYSDHDIVADSLVAEAWLLFMEIGGKGGRETRKGRALGQGLKTRERQP